jgi:hypothetical protein
MKKLTVISAALIALSFAGITQAQAQESSLTREAVIAELTAARASGELAAIQRDSYARTVATMPTVGAKTRAEVVAELTAARASGELAAIQSQGRRNSYEQGGAAAPVVGKTRAEVKAELQAARASGELAVIQSNGYYTPAQARVNTSTVLAGQPRNPQ